MSEQPPLTAATPTPLPPRSKQRGWISVLAALLLLVSGGVIGGVVGALVVRNQVIKAINDPHGRMMRMSERMRENLNLTDEQHDKIKKIFEQHHTAILQRREEIVASIGLMQHAVQHIHRRVAQSIGMPEYAQTLQSDTPPSRHRIKLRKLPQQ